MQYQCKTMQNAKTTSDTTSVGILLFPGFSNHCLANAVEPLRAANGFAQRPLYRWHFLTIAETSLTSSSGLPVMAEARLSDHPRGDILLVMPSYSYREAATPQALRALRAAHGRFKTLVGLDTGSWLLAAAGLLDGRRATIHWDVLVDFAEAFPEVDVTEERFVIDGDRMSCGGATTTFELMLELIGRQHGTMLQLEVAALFMHGERDPRLHPLIRAKPDRIVSAAAAIMRRHVEDPITIGEIAGQLKLTPRALEQHFAAAADRSPRRVYTAIRLRAARRLVEQSHLSIVEIATRSGYRNASAMTRAFKREFGVPPQVMRRP